MTLQEAEGMLMVCISKRILAFNIFQRAGKPARLARTVLVRRYTIAYHGLLTAQQDCFHIHAFLVSETRGALRSVSWIHGTGLATSEVDARLRTSVIASPQGLSRSVVGDEVDW
jgi:hypothetical protein